MRARCPRKFKGNTDVLAPLLRQFFAWLRLQHEQVKNVRGLLCTATRYATRHEAALLRFLDDGRLLMTNNHSERTLPISTGPESKPRVAS